jgi:hypothetical protein
VVAPTQSEIRLYPRCAGLDVHKDVVVVRVRCVSEPRHDEVKSFETTTAALLELNEWLSSHGVSHVAMEATGVYWKPNFLIRSAFVRENRQPGVCAVIDADQCKRQKLGSAAPSLYPTYFCIISRFYRFIFRIIRC